MKDYRPIRILIREYFVRGCLKTPGYPFESNFEPRVYLQALKFMRVFLYPRRINFGVLAERSSVPAPRQIHLSSGEPYGPLRQQHELERQ
jgi:hypothetical protein